MGGVEQSSVKELRKDAEELYQRKGFKGRLGFGKKPALVIVDLAKAWTDPNHPLGSNLDHVVEAVKEVLEIARRKGMPVIYTTMAYDSSLKDAGLWIKKIPALGGMIEGGDATKIDPRLQPNNGEIVLTKKFASAFAGTNLSTILSSNGVDTLIVTGCSTSACVRDTATDALSLGLRPIVPRECVGDRAKGPHEWNLFDIDAKFGDVVSKEEVLEYLESLH